MTHCEIDFGPAVPKGAYKTGPKLVCLVFDNVEVEAKAHAKKVEVEEVAVGRSIEIGVVAS